MKSCLGQSKNFRNCFRGTRIGKVEGTVLGIFQSVARCYATKLPSVIEENQNFSRLKSGYPEGRYEAVGTAASTFDDRLFPGRSNAYSTRLSRLNSPPCVVFPMCIDANCI